MLTADVGTGDGWPVGIPVGPGVGTSVGPGVGAVEGSEDGAPVGRFSARELSKMERVLAGLVADAKEL